jgi:acyl transferase domain-containing protein/NAD(P)H-dependent flavin oxidoreductase YrpB (nitropropane dioxygenase family)/NAD(P)-dependent dehydrogenase (short-subunit alcohol dehydrogenase family)
MKTTFQCLTLSPLRFGLGIIQSTLRAGGIALADVEREADVAGLDALSACLVPEARVGLRVTPERAALADRLDGPHRLVLAGWEVAELPNLLGRLQRSRREIWLEALGCDDLVAVDSTLPFAGWLARGSECGGRSGRQSAFILAQALAKQAKPFWVQGGIGTHSAAACRAMGAAGIVLDDALLLLRESGLPPRWQAIVAALGSGDTAVAGAEWGLPWRFASRHDLAGGRLCTERAAHIGDSLPVEQQAAAWREVAETLVGWGDPATDAWPLGQVAGRAATFAARYGTVGRLLRAVRENAEAHIGTAARMAPLAPDAALARSHGTRHPIVQGPMTRVSDIVGFAREVAEAGALPLLALATMSGPQVAALLKEASTALAGEPWGVGLLGYNPPDLAAAQLAAVEKARPAFALFAGGRPDQAARLEARGIATYIHASSPETLQLFLEQGARRFVFEGAECGGHVGPLNSFPLWDAMTDVLSAWSGEELHVLFAGGIHDARSAAAVAALSAPLQAASVHVGVLIGTAYLFTQEAVAAGSITSTFQREALNCRQTALIETRPGHRIRCMPTAFVDRFTARRRELIGAECPPAEMAEALEALVTGRLRLASKGLERDGNRLRQVDEDRSRAEGLFMVGEVAALREGTQSCADLHEDISAGSTRLLAEIAAPREAQSTIRQASGVPVAIIGIGCLLPGAHDPETLWRNFLDQVELTEEIPAERWDWRLYYDPDPEVRDRISSKWGCFLKPAPIDPLRFGIPPNSLHSICLPQLLALEASRRAIEDAGGSILSDARLREKTAVIFGVGSAGDLEQMFKTRTALPLIVGNADDDELARLPEWTEESYPGILLNVVAGRVANRFDFSGPNFTVDAACASSLAALDLAVRELQSGRSDLALAGAVDAELSPHAFTAFSKTRALSLSGKARPFDEAADGIVLSEGVVVLILKRLADAERDGDRIYAAIRGVAGSSDGKGMGLTAPKPAGQIKALERAHEAAGTDIASMGFYEAHATGTKVGDRAELETLTTVLKRAGAPSGRCAVGAAKALLGHTRSTAGLVGTVKAALALHHRTLPPQAGVQTPLAPLRDPTAPIYLSPKPRPWLRQGDLPRRAGISGFGFGGTNFHAVLEEHADFGPDGAASWPAELFAVSAGDRDGLLAGIDRLERGCDRIGAALSFRDLAFSSVVTAAEGGPFRLAAAARSTDELRRLLANARSQLSTGTPAPAGAIWCDQPVGGELAFLFPGQGSQHCFMGAELALYCPEMYRALDASTTRDFILPRAGTTAEEHAAAERALATTSVAQPAIAAVSCGMLDLARRMGLQPSRVAGHSFGEFVALHAAGVIDRDDLMRLAVERGRLMADVGPDPGTMAVVVLDRAEIERYISSVEGVWIANVNAPRQLVVSGTSAGIERLLARLTADGHTTRRLPVTGAFHSPLVAPASAPFAAFLAKKTAFKPPRLPVHANRDGRPYPSERRQILRHCSGHMEQPVDLTAQVEAMWKAGVRSFLELGPGRVLSELVTQILGDRPHLSVAGDGGIRGWLTAVARLWTHGQAVDLDACFAGRPVRLLDLDRLPDLASAPGWLIDGGRVSRVGAPGLIGELPFFDAGTRPSPVSAGHSDVTAAYGEYQETMRRFLDQQERVLSRMLNGSAAENLGQSMPSKEPGLAHLPPREAPPPALAPPPKVAPARPATLDPRELSAMLLRLVSDRTGYPLEILRTDQDLEAELGVDSIKRIEIIGRLIKAQPAGIAERLQQSFETLVRAKSADALIDAILQSAPTLPDRTNAAPIAPSGACPRFVMRSIAKPLPERSLRSLSGLYLVSADGEGLADDVAVGLRSHGAIVCVLSVADRPSLAPRIAELRNAYGPVRGIIHLAALGLPTEPDGIDGWRAATAVATKNLFALLQACSAEMAEETEPLRIVSVSRMGGDWGRSGELSGSPVGGGAHGILRSAVREFPHILSKGIDFDVACAADTMTDWIIKETLMAGGGDEIGFKLGRRFFFHPEPSEFPAAPPSEDWRPSMGWVVLATGGVRGITAEICRELARPGVRLVLVGRSADGADGEASSERQANLAAFRKAGAKVEYHAVDVRSEDAFGGLIDELYQRYGRIDAVVHGAGIIEDQRFATKPFESFERVFDVKADSGFILSRHLRPDGLKWVVLFGSVAGRFGNAGQADYAAGNETLARLGCWMNLTWPATRVVTIQWGPWCGVGMASEGVQSLLGSQGIVPIEPAAGRRFFVDELSRGSKHDAEVIAGQGPWGLEPDHNLNSIFASLMPLINPPEMTQPADPMKSPLEALP